MVGANSAIKSAFLAGQKSWPAISMSFETFEDALETHAKPTTGDLQLHGADLYLAVACVRSDAEALRYFDGILTAMTPALRRYNSDDTFVDEAIQRVRIHLLVAETDDTPRIARYDARASLRTWVGVCTIRTALQLLRNARNAREVSSGWPDIIAALPTGQPELETVRTKYASIFGIAWRQTCAELPDRQRTLLRMCFVEGCTLETIASTYSVHRVTGWRWIEDAQRRLLEGTRERLRAQLTANDPGTASLLELVKSQLDLGLSALQG